MLKKWVGNLQVQNAKFLSTELKVDTLASILFPIIYLFSLIFSFSHSCHSNNVLNV